jgi:hypothetical protein
VVKLIRTDTTHDLSQKAREDEEQKGSWKVVLIMEGRGGEKGDARVKRKPRPAGGADLKIHQTTSPVISYTYLLRLIRLDNVLYHSFSTSHINPSVRSIRFFLPANSSSPATIVRRCCDSCSRSRRFVYLVQLLSQCRHDGLW